MGQEVEGFHLLDGAAFAGGAEEAEALPVLVPIDDLVDAGLFDFVGERGLAGVRSCAGQDVAAGEGDARDFASRAQPGG